MRSLWIILALALLVTSLGTWQLLQQFHQHPGDGRHPETYGFDLSNLTIPRDQLLAAGFSKDGIAALTNPTMLTPEALLQANRSAHGKYLLPTDLVIGVSVGNEGRAYPRNFLLQHEIVNDTLAGRPIAITYNPLCDSVVVFDRTIAGAVREFGVSGLAYNSNLVMYDRPPAPAPSDPHAESLWSQLQFRAIAGPAARARTTLQILPCQLLSWKRWQEQFPASFVLARPAGDAESGISYTSYFASDALKFPVSPAWSQADLPAKTPIMAILTDQQWKTFVIPPLRTMPARQLAEILSGDRLSYDPATESLWAGAGDSRPVIYAFAFAFHAHHPADAAYVPPLSPAP